MDELTIKRSELIDIATEAMRDSGITEEQHIEMCETAHSMKEVLLGEWVSERCGCLVGTAYRNELSPNTDSYEIRNKLGSPVVAVGSEFDTLIRDRIDGGYDGCWTKVVKVIDD